MASEWANSGLHADAHGSDLLIRVKGWQWWWEVSYLQEAELEVVSANEIHIPIGRRVRLELSTGDVIHTFWIPHLQGKMDLVPGRTNVLWLQADTPSVSRGQCAEYCGVQHAQMALTLIAESGDDFATWLANERRPSLPPGDSLGRMGLQVFSSAGCAYCHRIRGTNSLGRFGPDLTHLAQRRTIGAGALSNTREHLTRWIVQSQRIKPGNRMPNVPLDTLRQRALVHYLTQLK